jgi:transposase-like protein
MSRRRYTEEEKRKFLGEFERAGGSAAAFCREHGLAYQTLLAWRRKSKSELCAAKEVEFVEVEMQGSGQRAMQGGADPAVELVLAGGSVLRIYPSHQPRP